jgi:hypothetical protein
MRRAVTLGAFALTALAWSGCDAKKQTEYVAGVSTQVQVPRDLKAIRIDVSVGGALIECRAYRVYDGKVQLPRSLGNFPATGTPGPDPLTVTVAGFTEEFVEGSGKDVFDNCTVVQAAVGDPKQAETRILRRSRQPYVLDSVLFLPMPLRYSCFDKGCPGENETCKAGRCVDAKIDEAKLPKWTDDLLDGTGGNCFSASQCFAAAVPPVVVDPNDCTFALPNTPSAPPLVMGAPANPIMTAGDGINVEVIYDGGFSSEILDKDPDEGFTIPDPTKPQRFRLTPGLCDLYKGTPGPDGKDPVHRITAIRAAALCQAKGQFQPLCANDQLTAMGTPLGVSTNTDPTACHATELKPAKSALAVLVDDSTKHHIFFESDKDQAALNISLSDPAFKQTDIGLTYFPGKGGTTCAGFVNKVPFTQALTARDLILKELDALNPTKHPGLLDATPNDLGMGPAIADVANALKTSYPKANRRAILVVGNRGFEDVSPLPNPCTPSPKAAVTAAKAAGVETYVIILTRDDSAGGTADAPIPAVIPNAAAVAQAGSPTGLNLMEFDARTPANKSKAQDAFRTVVEQIATCAYDIDPSQPPLGADDNLTYSDPISIPPSQAALYVVKPAAPGTCTTDGGPGDGWGAEATNPRRIHICGTSCTKYRDTLKKASVWSLQYQEPALAVPVFSHKKACTPTP